MSTDFEKKVDVVMRKLEEARAVSEWHYRDAVEELLIAKLKKGEYHEDWLGEEEAILEV
jgi:hypothetical protein